MVVVMLFFETISLLLMLSVTSSIAFVGGECLRFYILMDGCFLLAESYFVS